MPITESTVRKGLPRGAPSVEAELITGFINAWTMLVEQGTGADYVESALGQEAIRLGATAEAQRILDSDNGLPESPRATAMKDQAERLLDALDRLTTSAGEESGKIHQDVVAQTAPDDLFTPELFGFSSPL